MEKSANEENIYVFRVNVLVYVNASVCKMISISKKVFKNLKVKRANRMKSTLKPRRRGARECYV